MSQQHELASSGEMPCYLFFEGFTDQVMCDVLPLKVLHITWMSMTF